MFTTESASEEANPRHPFLAGRGPVTLFWTMDLREVCGRFSLLDDRVRPVRAIPLRFWSLNTVVWKRVAVATILRPCLPH